MGTVKTVPFGRFQKDIILDFNPQSASLTAPLKKEPLGGQFRRGLAHKKLCSPFSLLMAGAYRRLPKSNPFISDTGFFSGYYDILSRCVYLIICEGYIQCILL